MRHNAPQTWVSSLFFAEGVAFVVTTMLALILYQQLGLNNTAIVFYTSWLYLPWVLQPFWRLFLELLQTRRWWLLATELGLGTAFLGVALTIPTAAWLHGTLAAFALAACALAIHYNASRDIYQAELVYEQRRALRSVQALGCYLGMILGQGVLLMIAGNVQVIRRGSISYSWSLVYFAVSGLFIILWLWHGTWLPRGERGHVEHQFNTQHVWQETIAMIRDFLSRPQIIPTLFFLFVYLLPEGLLSKVASLFLVDAIHKGGLGLSPQEYGLIAGSVGVVGLFLGFVLGVNIISKSGLRRWIWPITLAATLPHALYLYLSSTQPNSLWLVGCCVWIAQMGFGMGLAAYIFYLNSICRTGFRTFYRSIGIALLAASMLVSGLVSGALQEEIGYYSFFQIAFTLGLLPFVAVAFVHIGSRTGKPLRHPKH